MSVKYTARSTSDRTEDWPFWMVVDERNINVTGKLFEKWSGIPASGGMFATRETATALAATANNLAAL